MRPERQVVCLRLLDGAYNGFIQYWQTRKHREPNTRSDYNTKKTSAANTKVITS